MAHPIKPGTSLSSAGQASPPVPQRPLLPTPNWWEHPQARFSENTTLDPERVAVIAPEAPLAAAASIAAQIPHMVEAVANVAVKSPKIRRLDTPVSREQIEQTILTKPIQESIDSAKKVLEREDTPITGALFHQILFTYHHAYQAGTLQERNAAVGLFSKLRSSCTEEEGKDPRKLAEYRDNIVKFYQRSFNWLEPHSAFSELSKFVLKGYQTHRVLKYLGQIGLDVDITEERCIFQRKMSQELSIVDLKFTENSRGLQVSLEEMYQFVSKTEKSLEFIQKTLDKVYKDPTPKLPKDPRTGQDITLRPGDLFFDPITRLHLDPRTKQVIDPVTHTPIDLSWHIQILPTSLSTYKLGLPQEFKSLKKMYSIFLLLKAVENKQPKEIAPLWKTLTEDLIFQFLEESGIDQIPHRQMELIYRTFQTREKATEDFDISLQALFPDAEFHVAPGLKPLSDLFQNSPDLKNPAAFAQKHGLTIQCAEMFQEEPGCIVLPEAMQLQTYSDEIQSLLETLFDRPDMRAQNGDKKTFLTHTRAPGLEHLSNLGIDQLEKLSSSLKALTHMVKISGTQPHYTILLERYRQHEIHRLHTHFSGLKSAVTRTFLDSIARILSPSIGGASLSFQEIQQKKREIFQRFFQEHLICPNTIWEEKVTTITEEELLVTVYKDARLPKNTGDRSSQINSIEAKFQAALAFFETLPIYQTFLLEGICPKTNAPSFSISYQLFKKQITQGIQTARQYSNSDTHGIKPMQYSLYDFEQLVYHLSYTKSAQSPFARKQFLKEFVERSAQDGWEGCPEGFASRISELHSRVVGADIQNPTLAYKHELRDFTWNIVHPSFVQQYGDSTQKFRTWHEFAVSDAIGLGIDTSKSSRRVLDSKDPLVQASIDFIKAHLLPYDLFLGYYDLYLKELREKEATKEEPIDLLCAKLRLDEEMLRTKFFDPVLMQWDYFGLQEELPFWTLSLLLTPQPGEIAKLLPRPYGYRAPLEGSLSSKFDAPTRAHWEQVRRDGIGNRQRAFRWVAGEESSPWAALLVPPAANPPAPAVVPQPAAAATPYRRH